MTARFDLEIAALGGGKDLQSEIYAQYDLYSIDCNMLGPETSGCCKQPAESLDSLRELKTRFSGLSALRSPSKV